MRHQDPLTLGQDFRLACNVTEATKDLLVAIYKAIQCVRDARVVAKLLHDLLCLSQVVPRHTRVKMVYSLELQSAVKEVQPLRAVNIHGCPKHALGKGFCHT